MKEINEKLNNIQKTLDDDYKKIKSDIYGNGKKGLKQEVSNIKTTISTIFKFGAIIAFIFTILIPTIMVLYTENTINKIVYNQQKNGI